MVGVRDVLAIGFGAFAVVVRDTDKFVEVSDVADIEALRLLQTWVG